MNHTDIMALHKEIEEYENEMRTKWLADLQFGYSDDQWPATMRAQRNTAGAERPCLTINKIPAHARQIINDMRQSRASIKVLPVDDNADIETAEVLNGIIRHIEHVSNAEQAYSMASEYQVMMGVGFFRIDCVYVDELYGEQEIAVNLIRNPFSVYLDPWSTDIAGGDANHGFITSIFSERNYKENFSKAKGIDLEVMGRGDNGGWFTEKGVRVAEFFSLEDANVDYVFADGKPYRVDDYDSNTHGPVEREKTIKEKRLKWQLINGADIIEERDKPGRYIPIVRVAGEDYDIDGERQVHGIVRRARDAQLLYNFTASANAEHNALQPKAPWLVADESLEGHEDEFASANRTNHAFLTYNAFNEEGNPIPPPQRQFPTGSNTGLLAQLQISDGDIQATIGQFAASLGQPSNEQSGIAIKQRQRVGDIATFHYADNMGRAIKQAGRIIVDLIPQIYDTARVARILGEEGDVERVQLNPEIQGAMEERQDVNGKAETIYNVGVGKYDVAVTVGPSYNTRRQEAFEHMAQMTQGNPALWGVIGDLLVRNMDWPGAEEMAERLKNTIPPEIRGNDDDEEQPQIDPQVMAQFQQLQQALEQLNMQNQELAQTNQQLQSTVEGKVIEMQMKEQDRAIKQDELTFKQRELEHKHNELLLKREELMAEHQEKAMALGQQAEKDNIESTVMAELVATVQLSAQQTVEVLGAIGQTNQQQAVLLAAMIEQMNKPKMLSVETDGQGNVVGGMSRTVN